MEEDKPKGSNSHTCTHLLGQFTREAEEERVLTAPVFFFFFLPCGMPPGEGQVNQHSPGDHLTCKGALNKRLLPSFGPVRSEEGGRRTNSGGVLSTESRECFNVPPAR